MRHLSITVRAMAAAFATAVLLAGGALVAPAASAHTATQDTSTLSLEEALVGDWRGPFSGFENNWNRKGFERLNITKVVGASAVGTWQFKDKASDSWSKKEPLRLIALPAAGGGWTVTGADRNGLYDGTLNADGTSLDLAYQYAGKRMMAYYFDLSKK